MLLIALRPLILVLFIVGALYVFYRIAKKIVKNESRKEAIEEKKEGIKEIFEEASNIPKVNKEKLQEAEKKVKDFIK